MVTKTLTITEDAYESLKRIKAENESFSQLFLKLSQRNLTIKDLRGKLKEIESAKDLQKRVKKYRERINKEAKKRYESLR